MVIVYINFLLFQSEECLPEVTSYNITASSSGKEIMSNVITPSIMITLDNISFAEMVTVTVTPSNTIDLGMPNTTVIGKSLLVHVVVNFVIGC